jgi:hypothetical protein
MDPRLRIAIATPRRRATAPVARLDPDEPETSITVAPIGASRATVTSAAVDHLSACVSVPTVIRHRPVVVKFLAVTSICPGVAMRFP